MKTRVTIAAFAATLLLAGAALADRGPESGRVHEHVDMRHGHNHSYADRGAVVRGLPREARVVTFGRERYWFHGGVWYRAQGPGLFVVVAPPIGIFVPVLPPFYTTVLIGGIPYYYANDAYYVYRDPQQGYEVVEPPPGADAMAGAPPPGGASAPPPTGGDNIFVYPKNGQPPEQQARDRYECHRWAADQTGFDPTRSDGGVAPQQAGARRADYLRAMNACLEGRGYTVR